MLVPYEEIGDWLKLRVPIPVPVVPMVIDVAPIAIPSAGLVTVEVTPATVTGADAVMPVAPAELLLAALTWIEAIPLLFVNAVPEAGVNTASALDAVKDTTANCTGAPVASVNNALAVIYFG